MKYKILKKALIDFLFLLTGFFTVMLAAVSSKLFLLLLIPFILILAKIEKHLVFEKAPPMPEGPSVPAAEAEQVQKTLCGNGDGSLMREWMEAGDEINSESNNKDC